MKTTIALLLILLASCTPRHGVPQAVAAEWSTTDVALEVAYQVVNVIDHGQTLHIARHPDRYREAEAAPFIGRHPSTGRVNSYFLLLGLGHAVVSDALSGTARTAWQVGTAAHGLHVVWRNKQAGIQFDWRF